MAATLLNQVSSEFGGDVLDRIGTAIGESPGKIKMALGDILPALLGGLASKAETREGAHELLDVIHRDHLDTEQYSHVADAIKEPGAVSELMHTGAPLLDSVLGGKTGAVNDYVASHAGLDPMASKSLMSLALPLVLGLIGRKVGNGGESGLMNLLGKPRNFLQDLPSGLAGVLGLGGATAAAASARPALAETMPRHTGSYTDVQEKTGSWRKWLLPLLALVGLAWLASYFLGRREPVSTAPPPPAATAPATPSAPAMTAPPPAATAPAETAPTAPAATAPGAMASGDLGAMIDKSLPGGLTLRIPGNGVESKLIAFIEDPAMTVSEDKWFSLDRLEFETASATLKPSSEEQLRNVAAIMKSYPEVNMRIGGYTDNTGSPDANLLLSKNRANSAMQQLVTLGVEPTRLTAEGYGEKFPVADNSTDDGRQRNRRVDVNVTKK
ncbi:OmpA family protein [Noviherbaspirillum cavernae]|nr:OmpA family protein [Noviherbaspirillum cavernae]